MVILIKDKATIKTKKLLGIALIPLLTAPAWAATESAIVHDAEFYISQAQNQEKRAADDLAVEAKLTAIREANGGKIPFPQRDLHLVSDETRLSPGKAVDC